MNDPYGSWGPMKERKNPLKILSFVRIKNFCFEVLFLERIIQDQQVVYFLKIFTFYLPYFLKIVA